MTTAYRQSLQNTQTFFYSCGWLYLVLWFFFFFFSYTHANDVRPLYVFNQQPVMNHTDLK